MSTGGDSSDDEFDDLFSFNTAVTPKGKDAGTGTATERSSSPINFDIDLSEREDPKVDPGQGEVTSTTVTSAAAAPMAASEDAVAEKDDDDPFASIAIASNSISAPAASDSAHTSDTSSYYKVSPPSTGISTPPNESEDTNNDTNDNDNNQGHFDLDLGAAKPTISGLGEDDFHAMDSDTRDFLDFLDKEPEKKIATSTLANEGFSDDESGDGMDIDDMDIDDMDFVDINTDSNEQEVVSVSDKAAATTSATSTANAAAVVDTALSTGILDDGSGSNEDYSNDEDEGEDGYKPGGYHPVKIAEVYNQR